MKGTKMSDEVTKDQVEAFAEKLEQFNATLDDHEKLLLSDMVSMAANVDPAEVAGFADFGMRQLVVGLPFGGFDKGGFGGPVLRAQEITEPPKWNN